MQVLERPRRVGFGGLADFPDLSSLDNINLGTVPTTPSGTIDWSAFTLPQSPNLSVLTQPITSPQAGSPLDFKTLTNQIVSGAQNFFNAQNAINQANYGTQLAKAQAQAAINIAKAGGTAAARTAGAGTPSPSLLLVAGLGLAAVLLLKK